MSADMTLQFCSAQNLFGNGTTVQSTDWIDMKVAQDNGGGSSLELEVLVTTAFTGGTGAVFVIQAVDSSGGSALAVSNSVTIPVASLTVGSIHHVKLSDLAALPGSTLTHLRFAVFNSGNNTAGACTAHLVPAGASTRPAKAYPAGF
ncbi:MAG: hypothetical protein RJA36_815 [Pseudomonadota bacterium]|jgi:hypothetical protein